MNERLHVRWRDDGAALLRFGFDGTVPDVCNIACARLAGPAAAESWCADAEPTRSIAASLAIARSHDFAMVQIAVDERETGIVAATDTAYRHLLGVVRGSSQPYLLRIWNYFAQINAGSGDAERYRQFCIGRARAVDAAFNQPPPAATAIGTDGAPDVVKIIALCTREPGVALENPRQTPAWQYPREFGPVPPGFSRGALTGTGDAMRLLASGTASIVGHVSRHVGDLEAQIAETFANLHALLEEASGRSGRTFSLGGCESLRVYLRSRDDLARAQTALRDHFADSTRVLFLRGDVCRRELDIEIEGVFAPD